MIPRSSLKGYDKSKLLAVGSTDEALGNCNTRGKPGWKSGEGVKLRHPIGG